MLAVLSSRAESICSEFKIMYQHISLLQGRAKYCKGRQNTSEEDRVLQRRVEYCMGRQSTAEEGRVL